MSDQLNEALKKLARARHDEDVASAIMKAIVDEARSTPAYQNSANVLSIAKELQDKAKEEISALALAQYELDQNKRPVQFVEIKEFSVPHVMEDEGALFNWIDSNLKIALSVDKKVLVDAAKAKGSRIPAEIVHFTKEPRVTISQDLSALLEEES